MIDDPSLIVNEQSLAEPEFLTATVAEVTARGYRLIFPGQSAASEKVYKGNSAVRFYTGQRVRVLPDGGTYIVEYPISGPNLYRTVSYGYNKESAGIVTWEDEVIKVSYSNINYSGVDVRTDQPIDLTAVSKIEFTIRITTFSDPRGLFVGAVKSKLAADVNPPWADYFDAYKTLTSAGLWHVYVDVSALSGDYYVCCHAYSQAYIIKAINLI